MGISQHVHGTDNARCLIALALSTGQIGKPGSGLHPLRGQNNVQGASDAGLILCSIPTISAWARSKPGSGSRNCGAWRSIRIRAFTVVETIHAAKKREIRGMFVMGENPAMSDPDVDHAREALCALDSSCGAGYLPDRDRLPRRRCAGRHRVAGEVRHRHQHGSHGAARA